VLSPLDPTATRASAEPGFAALQGVNPTEPGSHSESDSNLHEVFNLFRSPENPPASRSKLLSALQKLPTQATAATTDFRASLVVKFAHLPR
jgi:hypothetical protein